MLLEANANTNKSMRRNKFPLHGTCYNAHVGIVSLLLRYQAEVDAHTEEQWAPLHLDCEKNANIVSMLVEARADLNAETDQKIHSLEVCL